MIEQPELDDGGSEQRPGQELDVTHDVINTPSGVDEFLERNNLGLGYYEESELWQQVERFHDGMFGRAAFSEKILRKAIRQTIRELGRRGETFFDDRDMDVITKKGWRELDERTREDIQDLDAETDYQGRREYIEMQGREIWRRMSDEDRLEALEVVSGVDRKWTPPHLRILVAQHEMSRSKGARLLDNYFGRESKKVVETSGDGASSLLGRGKR